VRPPVVPRARPPHARLEVARGDKGLGEDARPGGGGHEVVAARERRPAPGVRDLSRPGRGETAGRVGVRAGVPADAGPSGEDGGQPGAAGAGAVDAGAAAVAAPRGLDAHGGGVEVGAADGGVGLGSGGGEGVAAEVAPPRGLEPAGGAAQDRETLASDVTTPSRLELDGRVELDSAVSFGLSAGGSRARREVRTRAAASAASPRFLGDILAAVAPQTSGSDHKLEF